ncbi:hypothetical protein ROA7450_03766 [Roseovarius albus]|uniref:Uncharacterized protein n=1 Tax=Roseovarius albus TaxID=1247867 RepID=A0A1X7A485_9RHOB|nr:hypothetical protein [Roseovarius albus]SLN69671.1 hypothetical protein ROA7450_03766 [Roseovarius albus]
MWDWIKRNSEAIEAAAAMIMAAATIIAIVGVKLQIDAAAAQQNAQSAREYYRGLLEVTLNKPELAVFDHCATHSSEAYAAYEHYVEYVLYTAEQTISLNVNWTSPLVGLLEPHRDYICETFEQSEFHPALQDLLGSYSSGLCETALPCGKR